MFKRKLTALDHPNPTGFDPKDETTFRNLLVWLEDQKVRHYKIEDRLGLRTICSGDWEAACDAYLGEIGCPIGRDERLPLIDWLLGFALRLEYGDNVDKYRAGSSSVGTTPTATNPLESLDFEGPDFKAGVASLAPLLQIPPHIDHKVVLKAICMLVRERLSKDALERHKQEGIKPTKTVPLEQMELGFETPDYITAEAAKVLRLLHIHELRELQNGANEAIVTIQKLTANPKTDTRLGKVGRS